MLSGDPAKTIVAVAADEGPQNLSATLRSRRSAR